MCAAAHRSVPPRVLIWRALLLELLEALLALREPQLLRLRLGRLGQLLAGRVQRDDLVAGEDGGVPVGCRRNGTFSVTSNPFRLLSCRTFRAEIARSSTRQVQRDCGMSG